MPLAIITYLSSQTLMLVFNNIQLDDTRCQQVTLAIKYGDLGLWSSVSLTLPVFFFFFSVAYCHILINMNFHNATESFVIRKCDAAHTTWIQLGLHSIDIQSICPSVNILLSVDILPSQKKWDVIQCRMIASIQLLSLTVEFCLNLMPSLTTGTQLSSNCLHISLSLRFALYDLWASWIPLHTHCDIFRLLFTAMLL